MEKRTVYIISGTLGSGKSTVAKLLASQLKDSVLISADSIMDMLQNDKNPDWENKLTFVWDNVIYIAKNALQLNLDVVIEGVVENEYSQLTEAFKDHTINYAILTADEKTITARIQNRGDEELIKRSMDVLQQFKNDPQKTPHLIDTSNRTPEEIVQIILNKTN